jgi:hypothetical protein
MPLLNSVIIPIFDMHPLQKKQVRFFLVFVLPLLLLGLILGVLQVSTKALIPLEQGVKAGYSVAVLIWLSFVLSIIADAALIGIAAFNTFNDKPVNKKMLRVGVTLGIGAVIIVFLVIQLGTHILTPLETGIADGEVPLSLAGIASILALFGTAGAFLYATKFRITPLVLHPDGGIKTEEVVVKLPSLDRNVQSTESQNQPVFSNTSASSANSPTSPGGVHVSETPSHAIQATFAAQAPTHQVQEPTSSVSVQDLKLVEQFVSRRDLDILAGQTQTGEDRDLIQTKANVAEWILLSLRLGGKVAKSKLESSFEEQFPKIYVPLFNSVLYDLIYKNKVDSVKEGSRMMLFLKEEGTEGGNNTSKT